MVEVAGFAPTSRGAGGGFLSPLDSSVRAYWLRAFIYLAHGVITSSYWIFATLPWARFIYSLPAKPGNSGRGRWLLPQLPGLFAFFLDPGNPSGVESDEEKN